MTPEEVPGSRQTWLTTQKEQERERRRLRDRQRRQSMSIEEREKHLARRRRNYQLRRQRTGLGLGSDDRATLLDSQQKQTSIITTSKINTMYEDQEAVFLPERGSTPDDAVAAIADSCNVGIPSESDMNYGGGKAGGGLEETSFPRRLRVKQIRHLARLLNTSIGEFSGEVQQIADVNAEQSVISKSESRKSLRLIHVKRLARALNSTVGKTLDQNHLNESQGPAMSMAPMEDQQCIQL